MSKADAIQKCQDLGKIVAYGLYDVGLCIPIGLVRTIIATCYIAKHAIYSQLYQDIHEAQIKKTQKKKDEALDENVESYVKRRKQNREAELKTRKAKGWFNKGEAKGEEYLTKTKNWFGKRKDNIKLVAKEVNQDRKNVPSYLRNESIQTIEEQRREAWYAELVRGISEIFLVGAWYHTATDNFSKNHKVSPLGLKELYKSVEAEDKFDRTAQEVIESLKELGLLPPDFKYDPVI